MGCVRTVLHLSNLHSWWIKLGPTYKVLFPLIKYKADQAVRKLMQMPVTVVAECVLRAQDHRSCMC